MSATPPRRISTSTVVAALFILLFFVEALLIRGGLIDDSYISFRYALNWAEGHGLTYNRGAPPVEGFTNFSWVALTAVGYRLGIDPATFSVILGIASGVALLAGSFFLSRRLVGHFSGASVSNGVGLLSTGVLALTPTLVLYAVSGLETVLYAALLLWGVGLALLDRVRSSAFVLGLTLLTRPEGALWALLCLGWVSFRWRGGHVRAATFATGIGIYAAIAAGFALFKWMTFGELIPNTFYAKPPASDLGWSYASTALLPLVGFALPAILSNAKERPPSTWVFLALSGLGLAMVILTGGDWMPLHRRLLPVFVFFLLALDPLVVSAVQRTKKATIALALAGGAFLIPTFGDFKDVESYLARIANYDPGREALAESLRDRKLKSVGAFDIGIVGYTIPEIRIFDFGGLTDRTLARQKGKRREKAIPEDYFKENAPDALLINSHEGMHPARGLLPTYGPEAKVLGLPFVQEHYTHVRQYHLAEDLYLHLLIRRRPEAH